MWRELLASALSNTSPYILKEKTIYRKVHKERLCLISIAYAYGDADADVDVDVDADADVDDDARVAESVAPLHRRC